ncbi:porin family protein [Maricaulaceae bacterium MS644]
MKTFLLSAAAALITASAASAQAPASPYTLGAGYTNLNAEGGNYDALTLRGGYDVTNYFGVEGEALFGIGDEITTIFGRRAETSVNYGVGLFAKAQYPINETISVHGRVGYAWTEFEASAAGFSDSREDNGMAAGFGGEYAFSGPNALRADYTLYDYGNNGQADGWSLAYVRSF